MPSYCAAYNCSNYLTKGCGLSFHRIPKNPELRQKWTAATKRNFKPSDATVFCSKHFTDVDYETGGIIKKLKKEAIPSIFDFPSHLQVDSTEKQRRVLFSHELQVEFTPEMWEDKSEDTHKHKGQELKNVKRGRGRPRKKLITNENVHINGNSTSTTTGIFSESVACCALACPNTSDTHVMNRLPEQPSLRQTWVKMIDRLAWVPDVDSALCEIHFDTNMWENIVGGEKSLKPDAIPTLLLHGEAIKSWVTLDSTDNIEKLGLSNEENGDTEGEESDSQEEGESFGGSQANDEQMVEDLFVKQEALEPEIDMVEGSEEVLSGDTNQRQFETIFCDTAFPDQQHNSDSKRVKQELENVGDCLENPLSPETIYIDDQSESDQSEGTNEGQDSFKVNISDVKSLQGEESKDIFYDEDSLSHSGRMRAKRRSSSQLSNEFECPICERRLSRRKNLEIHIKKLHPNGELTGSQKRIRKIMAEVLSSKKDKQSDEQHPCFSVIAPPPTPPLSKVTQPLEASTVVTPPRPCDPSPAGGEMKKQFVLLVPNKVPEPPPPVLPTTDSLTFNVNVATVPPEKRLALRIKLKELVDAVVLKNLDPERIIIAYDGT